MPKKRVDAGLSRQAILARLKTLKSMGKTGITIKEAAEHLNCTYENARKLVKSLEYDGRLVALPAIKGEIQSGALRYTTPDDENAQKKYAILAAGKDIIIWFGEPFTRDQFIEEVLKKEVATTLSEDKPVAWNAFKAIERLFGLEFHNGQWSYQEPYGPQQIERVKREIEFHTQTQKALAELMQSILDNDQLWDDLRKG